MDNENHPSFGHRCKHQYSVKAHPNGMSSSGWGCGVSGGHCLPSDKCQELIDNLIDESVEVIVDDETTMTLKQYKKMMRLKQYKKMMRLILD